MLKVNISLDQPVNMNDNENPFGQAKALLLSDMNGSVCMDKLQDDEEPREPCGDQVPQRSVLEQWRNTMYAKLSTTLLTVSDVQNNTISKFADVEQHVQRIEEHV